MPVCARALRWLRWRYIHLIRSHLAMMSEAAPCEKSQKQAADGAHQPKSDMDLLRAVGLRGANLSPHTKPKISNSFLS